MKALRGDMRRGVWLVAGVLASLILAGCGDSGGSLTEGLDDVSDRDLSGIAGPPDPAQTRPVARVPRGIFGTANTADALAYPGLSSEERGVFERALAFFITDRNPDNGLGPVFNQPICLGCHRNSDQLTAFAPVTTSTPASRAARSGATNHALVTKASAANNLDPEHPPTAAFTLFGTFFPASGGFNPLDFFGGPIQHVRATGDCVIDIIPPESIDPTLRGGIDPATGLSALGGRRAVGERAAPPYIGRGLMEAIFAGDIVFNDALNPGLGTREDPSDTQGHNSSLAAPSVTNPECPGDCISGRHNENHADIAFIGGDPVIRLSRFGLRAAGPTLFQFMIGGTQGEIGLTSPFAPFEQNNNLNVGRNCDEAPDPELRAEEVVNLRSLIRLISLPDLDACLLFGGAGCASIENGAVLFGVDLAAFRSRLIPGMTPVGDPDGINQADRQVNCVGCHTPIMRTGQSPARVGGGHLSNKWVPLFSNLLIHNMGQLPQGRSNPVPPPPFSLLAGTVEIPRNLADFALPGQGLAFGTEWRTPPLMGIGLIGPPFLHDARVFLSTFSRGGIRARTVQTSTAGTNLPLVVNSVDNALLAAIDLHDLPPPGAGCPVPPGGSAADVCPPLNSANRSEARNVMQRWRALTPAEQQDVVNFLKAL